MFGQKRGLLDVFKKPVDPKELVRKWQSDIRKEQRSLERQIREISRETKNADKQVRHLLFTDAINAPCSDKLIRHDAWSGVPDEGEGGCKAWGFGQR